MAQQLLQDLTYFTPELALAGTFLIAIVMDLIFRRTVWPVAFVVLGGFGLTLLLLFSQSGTEMAIFSNMIAVDPFAFYFKLVIVLCAIFVTVFSMQSSELNMPGRTLGEYYALLPAVALGIVLMAGASNLLMMYLAVELSSVTSYILAGYTKEAPDSSEASLKYIIYGALSSGLMLYGISIIYGLTGSLDLYAINAELPNVVGAGGSAPLVLLIAGVLTLAGLGYKISAVPFHFWAPDVYEGAPVTITALLAVASKAGGFALLIRFFKVTFIDTSVVSLPEGTWASLAGFEWYHIVAVLAVLTMTVGNLVAIWQTNMKRLLAYSSIAHAGYMLMGVVVLSNEGVAAILIYFAVYLFMNLGAFYVVMLVANQTGSEDIEEYRGLGTRAPFMTVALTVFLISLTGLPPTAGFVGKLYLFVALLNQQWVWLAVVAAINTVVSLYYYARVIRNMFLRTPTENREAISFGRLQIVVTLVLLVPTLVLGVYFSGLADLANASVKILGTP